MWRWIGAITVVAIVASGIPDANAPLSSRHRDFPPFLMTIEDWNSRRIGLADGRYLEGTSVYRLEYVRHDHWTLTLVADEIPERPAGQPNEKPLACRDGAYGWIEPSGEFTETTRDPGYCNGVGRWIHYGIAWHYGWTRELADDVITLTDPGERVVFDRRTGLPLLYEAGMINGPVGSRTIFRIERWL